MNALSPTAPKPAHVSDAVVYDFDMFLDPGLLADPHERARELVSEAPPVFWTPRNGGHWMLTGFKENYDASRDTETFSSVLVPPEMIEMARPMLPPDFGHIPLPTPINMDPPQHTIYRAPLQGVFSPRAMMARREEIRELANSLIDDVVEQGHCDFIASVAEPLPVKVFLKMLGLPLDRLSEFRVLVHEFLAPSSSQIDPVLRMRKVADAMKGDIEARRTDPRDDLLSLLWKTEIDGKPMTFELMEDFGVLLFIAGLDTVINGMGYGIRHLARNPDFQARLRDNPKLIVEAAEEILRRYTFTVPTRRVTRDVEFAGQQMKENDRIMLFLPGADLDPREFANPEVYDMERENNVHIAFGVGPHRCLGSHLARIELQVIYEQMLARLPEFRLDPEQPARFRGGNILAMEALPIRWD
ncbi:cytochrome P450 [Novosphingobium malaysiense]|uniref:Cytochrome P450 n=1 Tax=Novosphingobium malaysiense TaxID=1348853 RepID=A0A0B1ZLK9_9SPHN|nr:cytochrome P450 [Novosphingobium malaysiense]KHK90140.1 cytochrome P450 [Novosphingobium malaysiense]